MTETSSTPPPAPDDTEAPPPPTPAPAGGPRRRSAPFARSSTDKVLGGVAGAVAARLDIEPVLARVVLVVLAIAVGGIVVPAYVLAWVIVARDDDPAPRLFEQVALREGGILMWILGTALAVGVIGGLTDPFTGPGNFPLLPLVLIGIGVALWTRSDRGADATGGTWPRRWSPAAATGEQWATGRADTRSAATPDPQDRLDPLDPTTGSAAVQTDTTSRTDAAHGDDWPPTPPRPAAVTTPPAPPARPRERSVLGPVTIALALIAAGTAAALDAAPGLALDLGATGVTATALLVLGLGLLVGTVWGRARWLVAVGLLLMPFVGVGLLVDEAERTIGTDLDISSGLGERRIDIVGDERLPSELDLLAGSIDVDLSRWQPSDGDLAAIDEEATDLAISIGAGEVDVHMPAAVAWRVVTDIGIGEYRIRGDGVDVSSSVDSFGPRGPGGIVRGPDGSEERFVRTGGPEGGPVLDVSVDVGLGQVTIRETEPTDTDGGQDPTTDDTEELS